MNRVVGCSNVAASQDLDLSVEAAERSLEFFFCGRREAGAVVGGGEVGDGIFFVEVVCVVCALDGWNEGRCH